MMEELEIYKSATGHKQTLLSSRWPAAGSLAAEAERELCTAWSSPVAGALVACARLQLQRRHLQLGGLWGSVACGGRWRGLSPSPRPTHPGILVLRFPAWRDNGVKNDPMALAARRVGAPEQ